MNSRNESGRAPTALLVEDSSTDAALVVGLLEMEGIRTQVVADAEAAFVAVRCSGPDIVVMDVVLERGNGFAACRQIKRDPATTHIPVIFLSSRTSKNDRIWGARSGAAAYLGKPVDGRELIATVHRTLGTDSDVWPYATPPDEGSAA